MENQSLRVAATLGVPGVALLVFYALLDRFGFQFSTIDPGYSAAIAALFLIISGSLTWYALKTFSSSRETSKTAEETNVHTEFKFAEETVTFTEKLRSIRHDVVKVHAHTHTVGVRAEYLWIESNYPESKIILQSLRSLTRMKNDERNDRLDINFDVIELELRDGRKKEIYFDISSFFDLEGSSLLDGDAMITKKILEIYKDQK